MTEDDIPTLERLDSLGERAYRALRDRISTGGLEPGERVTERALALSLGVSPTPIREALRRLEQERLVERVSARQLRIAAPSVDALRELLHTEAVARAAAARFATPKISDETLDQLEDLVEELEHDPRPGDADYQHTLATRFDELLLAATDNEVVTGMIDTISVFGQAAKVRAGRAMRADEQAAAARVRMCREVLGALRRRNADKVETLMRQHLSAAIEFVLAYAE
jgi:DNA-binding GntR family transcriptional regulator